MSITSIDEGAFRYRTGLKNFTIPSGVTSIGDGAFYGCSGLTSVTIPSSVTSIGGGAFFGCSGLTSVTIPSGVTSIGAGAFSGCSGLTSVTIPSGVTNIGAGAFYDCSSLTSVTIPGSVSRIGSLAFYGCSSLTSVTIPSSVSRIGGDEFDTGWKGSPRETTAGSAFARTGLVSIIVEPLNVVYSSMSGVLLNKDKTTLIRFPVKKSGMYEIPDSVTSIGDGAFYGCSGLTSVAIPSSVTSIGDGAFSGCSGLTSVTIPSSVTSIGYGAFYGCSGLTSVTIPSGVTSIGDAAFSDCTGLTSVAIPSGVTGVGKGAFSGCSGLTNVTIPSGVTSIGDGAFSGCSGLTSVTIPSSVTSIGDRAFSGSGLTSVMIPSSVTSIASNAFQTGNVADAVYGSLYGVRDYRGTFYLGTRIESIFVDSLNSSYSALSGVLLNKARTTIITVPVKKSGVYEIPGSVTSIGAGAFSDCSGLTSVTIPSSVTSIGDGAFSDCSGLSRVLVDPCNLVFRSLDGLLYDAGLTKLIVFPKNKLGPVHIPSGIEDLGGLRDATGITSISVAPENPNYSSMDGVLFNKDRSMLVQYPAAKNGAYIVPSGVRFFSESAFSRCSRLTQITMPSSVTDLSSRVLPEGGVGGPFHDCASLQSISVDLENPNFISVEGILFSKDKSVLKCYPAAKAGSYCVPAGVTEINYSAFSNCQKLTAVSLPDTLNRLESNAFHGCTHLRSVIIPSGVTGLGDNVFSDCPNLENLVFYGDAPGFSSTPVRSVSSSYKSYYFANKTGFTSPQWAGYPSATVPVDKGVYFLAGPLDANLLKGSAASQTVLIDNFGNGGASYATYALRSSTGSTIASGGVPADGKLSLPLRSLSVSGDYTVRVTRTYSDGTTVSVDSRPFHVDLKTWADAAGNYELMLEDLNGVIGDAAHYRGKLMVAISRTGAVSGRMLYNEAPHLEAVAPAQSPDWSVRAYTMVTRPFAASFTTSAGNGSIANCVPRLGVGTTANRQSLTLSVDFSTIPLQLKAEVQDYASILVDGTHSECATSGGTAGPSLTNLRSVLTSGTTQAVNLSEVAAARYAIASNAAQTGQTDPNSDNNAYLLIQPLPSGQLLWATRMTGYNGSGSGSLKLRDPSDANGLTLPFYESRSLASASQLKTTSLLGELCLNKNNATASWSVRLLSGATEGALERQSSFINKALINGKWCPVYGSVAFNVDGAQPTAFTNAFNWTGVSSVDFSDQNATAWSLTAGVFGLQPTLTNANAPLYLTAEDPVSGQNYVWSLSVSPAGVVRSTKYIPGDSTQPFLSMRLDRTRGEWSGSYLDTDRIRRNLFGVVLPLGGDGDPTSQGWVEAGVLPGMRTGGWWLGQ